MVCVHNRAATAWKPSLEYVTPKPGEPEVHRAARLGDAAALCRLAAAGEDLNSVFDISLDPGAYARPATPLMVAAGSGDGATVETVRSLLELGADPTLETEAGSAAVFACMGLGWNYRPGGDAAGPRVAESGLTLITNHAYSAPYEGREAQRQVSARHAILAPVAGAAGLAIQRRPGESEPRVGNPFAVEGGGGMSSLWWGVLLGLVVLIYKLAPPLRMRDELVLSLALVALGAAYLKMAI